MARILNGDKLIESVRNRTMCPDDTSVFTDTDILELVDEEMTAQVLDKLIALHGENLTIPVTIPRTDKGAYEIPYRAVGNKLRDISLISGNQIYELSQIGVDEIPDYSYGDGWESYNDKFYVQNNKINLINPTRAYDSVIMRYYLSPSYLTKTEEAGTVSAITVDDIAGTVSLQMSSVGKNFSSTKLFDLVGHRSPNKIKALDLEAVSLTISNKTGTVVFNLSDISDILSEIVVGDYVTLAQETPVPNIPTEMHPLLAQAAAVNILESLTDTEALNNATKRMDKMTTAIQALIDARVELAPKKIKPRHGTLQSSLGGGRGKRGRF